MFNTILIIGFWVTELGELPSHITSFSECSGFHDYLKNLKIKCTNR